MPESNVLVCTTPIRPVPTTYPPFGSMAVIQHLRREGHDPYFLDIDGLRPSWDDVVRVFEERRPKVVGISAVVSTAYAYTRRVAAMVKQVCPEAVVVVGGNLAASAEVLLRKSQVDVCVTGEGELPFANLVECVTKGGSVSDMAGIPGLVYLDERNEVHFTGYEKQIPATEMSDPDYTILERYSRIDNFLRDLRTPQMGQSLERDFARDPRFDAVYRRGHRAGTVVSAKGCVARCTFCHRWDKGYRQLPVARVIGRIRHLMDAYGVGFVRFGDENFGSDRRALDELIAALKQLGILWAVSGMRTRTVDRDLLRRMHDAGCVAVYYGIESGSQRMLEVMEKNTTVEQNLRALEWTREAGLFTIIQLVLGMPGEDRDTIRETTDFVQRATRAYAEPPADRLSINYAQALPGTPLYEYARHQGLLGTTLDGEERYLLEMSDTDAADDSKFVNFTATPTLDVMTWRPRIILESMQRWYTEGAGREAPGAPLTPFGIAGLLVGRGLARLGWQRTAPSRMDTKGRWTDYMRGGYFNIHRSLLHGKMAPSMYRMRGLIVVGWALRRVTAALPAARTLAVVGEWAASRLWPWRKAAAAPAASLRRVVKDLEPAPATPSEASMVPLRAGR